MIRARFFAPSVAGCAVAIVLAYASATWAQQAPPAPGGGAAPGGGGGTVQYFPGYPGGIAPTPAGRESRSTALSTPGVN